MDEILIEEKKYVSSKRAAKATGYAKDYIGQLCREGRVPARLVGRSWYVLESAIHDHRFGDQKIEHSIHPKAAPEPLMPTWEAPRYEASSPEILPSINRLRDANESMPTDDQNKAPQRLQDSWEAWFDRVTDTEPVALATLVTPEKQEEEKEKTEIAEEIKTIEEEEADQEISIPIRTVYEMPPEDLLPHRHTSISLPSDLELEEEQIQPQRMGRRALWTIQIAGVALAVLVATVAVIGTGYFDEYIISHSQVGIIAGVSEYNK